jgi:hypothetical protein
MIGKEKIVVFFSFSLCLGIYKRKRRKEITSLFSFMFLIRESTVDGRQNVERNQLEECTVSIRSFPSSLFQTRVIC